jgi:hypothetical protein
MHRCLASDIIIYGHAILVVLVNMTGTQDDKLG